MIITITLLRAISNLFKRMRFGLIVPNNLMCDVIELAASVNYEGIVANAVLQHTHFDRSAATKSRDLLHGWVSVGHRIAVLWTKREFDAPLANLALLRAEFACRSFSITYADGQRSRILGRIVTSDWAANIMRLLSLARTCSRYIRSRHLHFLRLRRQFQQPVRQRLPFFRRPFGGLWFISADSESRDKSAISSHFCFRASWCNQGT